MGGTSDRGRGKNGGRLRVAAWTLSVFMVLWAGVALRSWTWRATESVRFSLDYENAYRWGSEVLRDANLIHPPAPVPKVVEWRQFFSGYVGLYDRVSDEGKSRDRDYWLDYPPLRLLAMALWTKSVRAEHPDRQVPLESDVTALLWTNTVVDLVSALGMFCLVRLWARRIEAARGVETRWPLAASVGAAVLVWLNPAAVIITHGWPQWDCWLLPFYIFAMLTASQSRWFLCGLLLGAAALLKAQILIVSPFFPMWAIFSQGWRAGFHTLAGWATAFVAVVSPWLLSGLGERAWVAAAVIVAAPLAWYAVRRRTEEVPWLCLAAAGAVVACGIFANGSFSWYEIGLSYGSRRYLALYSGAVFNIPSLLDDNGWDIMDPVLQLDLGDGPVFLLTLRAALWITYAVSLVLLAMVMRYHAKRANPEVLLVLAAPCLMMFLWLAQMHERYLLWGAAMTAAAAFTRPRVFLLWLTLTAGSTMMVLTVMCRRVPENVAPDFLGFLDYLEAWADIAYPLILLGMFFALVYRPLVEGGEAALRAVRFAWEFAVVLARVAQRQE